MDEMGLVAISIAALAVVLLGLWLVDGRLLPADEPARDHPPESRARRRRRGALAGARPAARPLVRGDEPAVPADRPPGRGGGVPRGGGAENTRRRTGHGWSSSPLAWSTLVFVPAAVISFGMLAGARPRRFAGGQRRTGRRSARAAAARRRAHGAAPGDDAAPGRRGSGRRRPRLDRMAGRVRARDRRGDLRHRAGRAARGARAESQAGSSCNGSRTRPPRSTRWPPARSAASSPSPRAHRCSPRSPPR